MCYNYLRYLGGVIINDWMKNIPDDYLICDINLPGSHDSCTKKVQFNYFSKCHKLSIYEQLNAGIRFLDVRVEKTGNKLRAVHGIAKCYKPGSGKKPLYLDDVLRDCKTFLKGNPSEAIFLCIKRDNGASSEETFDTFFDNYLNDDIWYKQNRIPSLGEVRGKIVLINRCCVDNEDGFYSDNDTGINFSGWPHQPKMIPEGFSVVPIPRRDGNTREKYLVQDMYKLSPRQKWEYGILPLLENPTSEEGFLFNFFSGVSAAYAPRRYARYILKRFLKYELVPLKKYGWIIMDFPDEKVCRKIILTNF